MINGLKSEHDIFVEALAEYSIALTLITRVRSSVGPYLDQDLRVRLREAQEILFDVQYFLQKKAR